MNLKIDTLRKKIGLGYILITAILAIAVFTTIFQVQNINNTATRLVEQRYPAARASIELKNGINHSIAALRGWRLLKRDTFKSEFNDAWNEIRIAVAQLQTSLDGADKEGQLLMAKLTPLMSALSASQQEVMNIDLDDPDRASFLMDTEVLKLNRDIRDIIGQMDILQTRLAIDDSNNIRQEIEQLTLMEWLLFFTGLSLSILIGSMVTRSIAKPVANAVEVARQIGDGNLDTHVDVGGSRELRNLGSALSAMCKSLKNKTEETERYDWISKGQNRLAKVMQGDKETDELANDIAAFTAQYTHSDIAAIYLTNEAKSTLHLTGKYAFSHGAAPVSFQITEGLVGQCAASRQLMVLKEPDEKHIRVRSSFVDSPVRHVLVAPFLFEGQTLGVIELGKLDAFDTLQKEFIESIMESIGMAINSAITRKKIQELLEETQHQSEELQQQAEELEQNNEELEEQTLALKEQQEELQAMNEELEEQSQIVEQKNQALESARIDIELKARQLEVSSKYKSEFLANMSHELRTPLNSLLILANDLAYNKEGNLNDEQVESAEVISKAGHDLLNLINEILDLSKIEAGKMDLNISDVAINDLVSTIQRNFKKQAKLKGINLETSVDEALPAIIHTDHQRLEQVLKNLISNAIKFTETGDVKVNFLRDAGDRLSITVTDTGIGIPKDKQEVIFEAFQQAEGGTARKYGGTGLGLSISRELAKLLKGKITVESMEDAGSAFTVTIPLTTQNPDIKEALPHADKAISSRRETLPDHNELINYPSIEDERDTISTHDRVILIIEDDINFAGILARQAREKGFRYLAASTGEDGLLLARKYLPHAIILDIDLPGINGHLVLKELKGNPDLRHIPVHVMSVNERTIDPIKSGAIEYLTKPVTKEQLDHAFTRMEDFMNRKMKNLLIIEDDENLRKSIIKLIGNGDVQSYEAGTASEALQFFGKVPIDCMVLDIGLPDISGFELIKRLEKEHQKVPPIIIYTGRELTKQETEELQQYAETIIVKGVKSEERLLDETALFLHRTVKNLPEKKQEMITNLYDQETIFHGKKLLVVDDDMRNVFALSKVLKEKGFDIIKAENGIVALDALEKHPDTDLVLMDIMMPEMDGYECMRKIRQQKQFVDLPVIALTAKAMKEDRQKCINAGASDYLTKPVDVERLLSLMRIWINK